MKPISKNWTAEDRIRIAQALLPDMQSDIYAGRCSEVGRPNITTLQHILGDTPENLEPYRKECEAAVAKWEAGLG